MSQGSLWFQTKCLNDRENDREKQLWKANLLSLSHLRSEICIFLGLSARTGYDGRKFRREP